MNQKMTDIKYKLLSIITACALLMPVVSCKDDLLYDPSAISEGEAAISAKLNFYEISNPLNSRAEGDNASGISGGTPGNAIGAINSICVLLYDTKGDLVRKYTKTDLENYDYKSDANTSTSPDAIKDGHQAENKTAQASFNIGIAKPENRIPFGKYRMYAVANMGDLSDYDNEIQTESGLQDIKLTWNSDVAKNNQMFGYFTKDANKKSENFTGEELIINQDNLAVHAWIKRAVSKVTVAFNAQNLKENIWIYIKSVEIKDIPSSCYLGADTPGNPGEASSKGQKISFATQTQTITYHNSNDQTPSTDAWPQYVSKGHPIYGANPSKATDTSLSYEKRLEAQHEEDVNALYFFENMQGSGIEGTPSDKRQQVNQKDKDDQVTSYPDGNNPQNEGWKDAKPYGTYIEVKAYYFSINPGDPGQGDIVYRFMLGKDEKLDYNAMRNYHYKLTLCFNGYANDADWHIVYDKEDRKIENPNPYYISYLYNHSMMLPLDIDAGSATITKIEASIESNGWAPLNATDGATSTPGYNEYKLYWTPSDQPNIYPWNGFLSLRETTETVINGTVPYTPDSNKSFYENTGRGSVTYSNDETGDQYTDFETSEQTKEEALEDGKLHVVKKYENGNNHYTINMPLWTRAKQLIKATAYTGNNPFAAYQREAKLKVVVTLSDGSTLTTGLSTNNGQQSGELISIRQVRRIVNPKGIWRSGNNKKDFHVVLKILPDEEATTFKALASEGPWRAFIMRDTKRGTGNETGWDDANGTIHLEGTEGTATGSIQIKCRNGISRTYQTVEGSTGSDIDFWVRFNGTTSDDSPNHAIIRVEYHNYTCVHLIFVRQGYGADAIIEGGTNWMSCNNVTKDKIASSPLDEGSMFKFGNWYYPIASSNNKNSKSPWTKVVPDDFAGNGADNKYLTLASEGTAKWDTFNRGNSFEDPSEMKVAEFSDYKKLYDDKDIEQGYGILYGDESDKTLDNIADAYGYMASETNKNKGMRGCFVYNYRTGKNLFFPIGASGYGHRMNSINGHKGLLRYNSSIWRWGYFSSAAALPTYPGGITDCPLFFDVFRRPGAIYWFKQTTTDAIESGTLYAWDFNYFTFDFFPISGGNVASGNDACFVRCVAK